MKIYLKITLAAEFVCATFLLALGVPEHLVFQERCQLFLWTGEYFHEVISVPGGLSDWLGRFFTQFFLNPWMGAAIISALLVAFQRLLLGFFEKVPLWLFGLTILPVAILCAFYTNENAMLSAVIALILSLLAAHGVSRISDRPLRMIVVIVLTPIEPHFSYGPFGP